MIALALLAFGGAPDFTLTLDGWTNAAVVLNIPARPAWATGLELDIDHIATYGFGLETDEYGPIDAGYRIDATLLGNWKLGVQGQATGPLSQLAGCRTAFGSAEIDACVPFDGVWDWDGTSGHATGAIVPTSDSCALSLADLAAGPLVLGSRAMSYVECDIWYGLPWGSYEAGASVTYFTSSRWAATVRGRWLPADPPPLP